MTKRTNKIDDTAEAWETGALGCDPEFVKVAPAEVNTQIDDALGLQMISIRLQKELIEDLKMIAKVNGVGYQPLMRDALNRFAAAELKKFAIQYANEKAAVAAAAVVTQEKTSSTGLPAQESRLAA